MCISFFSRQQQEGSVVLVSGVEDMPKLELKLVTHVQTLSVSQIAEKPKHNFIISYPQN